jgi:hypothetical protein
MPAELALAGLLTSVVGTGASIAQGQKAQGEQRKQAARVSAQNAAAEAASRRKALREERIRRAQLLSQAGALGIEGSSTEAAGVARSGGIASESISQTSGALAATNSLSAGNQALQGAQARQQLFGNVASIGTSVFDSSGGIDKVEGLFKDKG